MRLVDADKLLYMDYEDAMNYIEHGCDYDPEKVVEELEAASYRTAPSFDEDGYSNDDSEDVVFLDRAIEIVEKGGRNDKA